MKRKAFMLALAAAVMLTACGGKKDTKDVQEPAAVEAEQETAAPEETVPEETVPEAEAPEEPEEEIPQFSKGTVDEDGWESSWLGMRFRAPEGMRMTTQEELDALMGLSAEILSDDLSEMERKYAELTSVKEMMCYDPDTNANVIVGIDLLPMEMSEELFAQALKETLEGVAAMNYVSMDNNEMVDVAGIPFMKCSYDVEAEGQRMCMDYYLKTIGNRAVSLVCSYGEGCGDQAQLLIDGFAAYEP